MSSKDKKDITEDQIRNSLYHLKSGQYLKRVWVKKRGKIVGFRFELTRKGKKLLQRHTLSDLRVPELKK